MGAEVYGGPVILHGSPWMHSAKRAETGERKHPLYLQVAPKHFAEPLDPKHCVLFCCRAAIASVGSATGAHVGPPRGFCSFSSLKPLLHFVFSPLDALSAGHCVCAFCSSPLQVPPFSALSHLASAGLVDSRFHRQPGHHLC